MNLKKIIKSELGRGIIIGLITAIGALIIFQAGISLGKQRCNFVHNLGDNFEKNFHPIEKSRFGRMLPAQGLMPNTHGTFGQVVSINLPELVIASGDNLEKTIVVNSDTLVRQFQDELKISDLKVGDQIVILGSPNDKGQIEARLIRLLPSLDKSK